MISLTFSPEWIGKIFFTNQKTFKTKNPNHLCWAARVRISLNLYRFSSLFHQLLIFAMKVATPGQVGL
jgi:hypothetical protein